MKIFRLLNILFICLSSLAAIAADGPAKFANGLLVAANGMTLYTFDKDVANSGKSACNGPCMTLWPPLMVGTGDKPAGDYSIVMRDEGAKQWAYKGKPLYFYQADKQAGDHGGDNFKDVWHVVKE